MTKLVFTLLAISFYLFHNTALAQQTFSISLRPDAQCGKDAFIWDAPGFPNANSNYGINQSLLAHSWTNSGAADVSRCLIQFDLGKIPIGAVITNAQLSLFNDSTSASFSGQHQYSPQSANNGFINRITTPWTEKTVTWNSQPTYSSINQVVLPPSTSPNQNYQNLLVTQLVTDMIANPLTSFGFMINLQIESPYRALVFASSDHPDPNLHPILEITYTLAQPESQCFTLRTDAGCNADAMVWNAPGFPNGNTNYGNHPSLLAHAWTNNGIEDTSRSLLYFDLSFIPQSTVIDSAFFSIYNDQLSSSNSGQHSNLSGPANALLQRVTSSWNDQTVTWMTKPSSATQNQVPLPAPTNPNQHYPNLNVTSLVQDMIDSSQSSYGFMMRLGNETNYRLLVFASGNNSNPQVFPTLNICYSPPVGVVSPESNVKFSLSPNPSSGLVIVQHNDFKKYSLIISDISGKLLYCREQLEGKSKIHLKQLGFKNGAYIFKLQTEKVSYNKLIILE